MSRFVGNVTFANVLAQPSHLGASTISSLTAILIALSIYIFSIAFWRSPQADDKIHKLEGFYLVTPSKFFSKRYDFFQENFKKTKMFCFNILQVSSCAGVLFYSTTELDFSCSIA
jgi:hypothetical protein